LNPLGQKLGLLIYDSAGLQACAGGNINQQFHTLLKYWSLLTFTLSLTRGLYTKLQEWNGSNWLL